MSNIIIAGHKCKEAATFTFDTVQGNTKSVCDYHARLADTYARMFGIELVFKELDYRIDEYRQCEGTFT